MTIEHNREWSEPNWPEFPLDCNDLANEAHASTALVGPLTGSPEIEFMLSAGQVPNILELLAAT